MWTDAECMQDCNYNVVDGTALPEEDDPSVGLFPTDPTPDDPQPTSLWVWVGASVAALAVAASLACGLYVVRKRRLSLKIRHANLAEIEIGGKVQEPHSCLSISALRLVKNCRETLQHTGA